MDTSTAADEDNATNTDVDVDKAEKVIAAVSAIPDVEAKVEEVMKGILAASENTVAFTHMASNFFSSLWSSVEKATVVGRTIETLFPGVVDNAVNSTTFLALKNITKAKELRAYLEARPDNIAKAYDVAAGKMSLELLSVVVEIADIRNFLHRPISLIEDGVKKNGTIVGALYPARRIFTLPQLAAKEGCIDVVTFLLDLPELGVDFFCDSRGYADMLRMACSHKKVDVVRLILSRGPDLSPAREEEGHSVAFYAVSAGCLEIVDCLYLAGASFENCLASGTHSSEVLIRLFDLGFLRLTENDHIIKTLTEGTFFELPFAFLYRTHKMLVQRGKGGDKFLTLFLEAWRVQERFKEMVVCRNYFLGQEDVDAETASFLGGYDIPKVEKESSSDSPVLGREARRFGSSISKAMAASRNRERN